MSAFLIGLKLLGGKVWEVFRRVPLWAWLVLALGIVLLLTRSELHETKAKLSDQRAWQESVVIAATEAFGEPGQPGYATQDVPLLLRTKGQDIRSLKDAIARDNAATLAAAADGLQRVADSRSAADDYDRGQKAGRTSEQLKKVKPATSPEVAGAEALELVRSEWSSLR